MKLKDLVCSKELSIKLWETGIKITDSCFVWDTSIPDHSSRPNLRGRMGLPRKNDFSSEIEYQKFLKGIVPAPTTDELLNWVEKDGSKRVEEIGQDILREALCD